MCIHDSKQFIGGGIAMGIVLSVVGVFLVAAIVMILRDRANFWNFHADALQHEASADEADEEYYDWLYNRGKFANGQGKPPDCKVCGK